ncbi:MAG: OmpA family protein [Novosphingobium sp.]|nr:OmpA family protein [Novosphingobium sp.]
MSEIGRTVMRNATGAIAACLVIAMLTGCDATREPSGEADTPDVTETSQPPAPQASPMPTGSIIRPDIEKTEPVEKALEPLAVTIGFAEGGDELDAAAKERLDRLAESEQVRAGWPIVVHGHSDSTGSDEANLRASRRRAQAVAAYLAGKGIGEARMAVIALGEQNPVAPNAKPDGTPDEEGRARNRRVEILVAPAEAAGNETESAGAPAGREDAS